MPPRAPLEPLYPLGNFQSLFATSKILVTTRCSIISSPRSLAISAMHSHPTGSRELHPDRDYAIAETRVRHLGIACLETTSLSRSRCVRTRLMAFIPTCLASTDDASRLKLPFLSAFLPALLPAYIYPIIRRFLHRVSLVGRTTSSRAARREWAAGRIRQTRPDAEANGRWS